MLSLPSHDTFRQHRLGQHRGSFGALLGLPFFLLQNQIPEFHPDALPFGPKIPGRINSITPLLPTPELYKGFFGVPFTLPILARIVQPIIVL